MIGVMATRYTVFLLHVHLIFFFTRTPHPDSFDCSMGNFNQMIKPTHFTICFAYLLFYLFVYLLGYLFINLTTYLAINIPACLSVCLSACLPACVSL